MAASGNGTALLQASVSYHVDEHKPTKPAYDFTVEVIETDGGSTLTIKLCSKYGEKLPRSSLSAFSADTIWTKSRAWLLCQERCRLALWQTRINWTR